MIQGTNAWRYRGELPNPYQVEHDVLIDAIRRDQPHDEVDYAVASTMTAIMGRMASYSGQLVDWETALNSAVRLGPDKCDFDSVPPARTRGSSTASGKMKWLR